MVIGLLTHTQIRACRRLESFPNNLRPTSHVPRISIVCTPTDGVNLAWVTVPLDINLRSFTQEGSLVATETRVRCTDAASLRSFRRYWRVIRPFSGLVRREALRAIRRTAESSP